MKKIKYSNISQRLVTFHMLKKFQFLKAKRNLLTMFLQAIMLIKRKLSTTFLKLQAKKKNGIMAKKL